MPPAHNVHTLSALEHVMFEYNIKSYGFSQNCFVLLEKDYFFICVQVRCFYFLENFKQIGDRENAIFPANLKTLRIFLQRYPMSGQLWRLRNWLL
jgi:hypothetical protein